LPELGKRNSGSGIQNSAPALASEKPLELRQNSGSGNSGAQHYRDLLREASYFVILFTNKFQLLLQFSCGNLLVLSTQVDG
jgi:hypothetical protein